MPGSALAKMGTDFEMSTGGERETKDREKKRVLAPGERGGFVAITH